MIADPPVLLGTVHVTFAEAFAGVTVPMVGAGARAAGVTALDLPEAAPVPIAFAAATVKAYLVPLVSPETWRLVAVASAGVVPTTVAPL